MPTDDDTRGRARQTTFHMRYTSAWNSTVLLWRSCSISVKLHFVSMPFKSNVSKSVIVSSIYFKISSSTQLRRLIFFFQGENAVTPSSPNDQGYDGTFGF
jgi:hypothetical protein